MLHLPFNDAGGTCQCHSPC